MTFAEYECHGRIAIYRAGPRHVSWPDVSILYRYIVISSHPYSLQYKDTDKASLIIEKMSLILNTKCRFG